MAGYDIYYGTTSGNYTDVISVGNVTNVTINDLEPGVTYYFSATSLDAAGDQSAYSNEATFAAYNTTASGNLNLATMPASLANDLIFFSLAAGAPAAAGINPSTGLLSWDSSVAVAGSTNNVTVIINDLTNPNASTQETLLITVADMFNLEAASVPVQSGQLTSLPLTCVSSAGITNLTFTLNWPGNQLVNPVLVINPPLAGGTLLNQGTNLLVQVWTANEDALTGTNQFAEINFQAAAGQASALVELPVADVAANAADGSTFQNIPAGADEVAVIGTNPLLHPQYSASQGRSLTLYAIPGDNYEIQCSTNLAASSWQVLQEYEPTNMVETLNLDSENPVAFYRLLQN